MSMHKQVALIFFVFIHFCHFGQEVIVRGEAKGYEGKRLAVVGAQDELSGKRILLAQADVNDSGLFEVRFETKTTRRIYLHLQRAEAPLYVQQGRSYTVVFPPVANADYKRFDNTEISLQLVDFPVDDINIHIRKFNDDYARFISEHFYDFATDEYQGSSAYLNYLGTRKEKVDLYSKSIRLDTLDSKPEGEFSGYVKQFEDSVNSSVEQVSDMYFLAAYKRFSIGELHLLSGMNRKQFYERYFMSITPLEHNPAFVNCFKLFTQNMLTRQPAPVQAAMVKAVNVDRDFERLAAAFGADSELLSMRLKYLAALLGLKEAYNNAMYDRVSIDILLGKVQTDDTLVDQVAAAVLHQVTRCRAGWQMQEVTFTDEAQSKWMLSDADGLPLYILFFTTWSPASLKEILVLERLQEKFVGRVQFVAVCMDDDYRTYRKYIEEHMKLPIKLLYGNAEPFVHEKFNVKAIPHQVLIDAEQYVVSDTCPAPSDPIFESFLNRIAAANAPGKQGQKTWRDH